MLVSENISKRLNIKNEKNIESTFQESSLNLLQKRLHFYGGTDQWTRMRQDKLRSLKRALISSYQRAIVQKYNVKKDSEVRNIISIITLLQEQRQLSENTLKFLTKLEEEYLINVTDRYSTEYISQLQNIVDTITDSQPLFRCLINHDKLKVDYEDKIISIPFEQVSLDGQQVVETGFHNGTIFKWVHGNKEQWVPDTYWIVYMQYSEETAYFRAEIRKADEEIEIIIINEEGQQETVTYRGWLTGPNETTALWNVKKNIVWNDLNYTKLLYITKDEDTLAFFQRFDRVMINGKPWEVQAYNENYSVNKSGGTESGIIRVALKEAYTATDQFVKETLDAITQQELSQTNEVSTEPYIDGPVKVKPFSIISFVAKNFQQQQQWSISNSTIVKVVSQQGQKITLQILTGKSNKEGFYINYGNAEETKLHIIITSF